MLKKFSKPRVSQNDGAKCSGKMAKVGTIFAARTPSCRLVCAVRNVPCARLLVILSINNDKIIHLS